MTTDCVVIILFDFAVTFVNVLSLLFCRFKLYVLFIIFYTGISIFHVVLDIFTLLYFHSHLIRSAVFISSSSLKIKGRR